MSAVYTGLAVASAVVVTAQSTYVDPAGVTHTVIGTGDPVNIGPAAPGAASKFVISEQ
jgi:hypothetical protein